MLDGGEELVVSTVAGLSEAPPQYGRQSGDAEMIICSAAVPGAPAQIDS
jgi:hypothetical protein